MKKRALLFVLAVIAALSAVACTDKETGAPLSVTMTIECLALAETPAAVKDEFKAVVPDDGYFMNEKALKAKENETLFDFVTRIAKAEKLSVVSADGYFSSIGNLSDKATTADYWGGWTFTVNGETPMDGETWLNAEQVVLQEGDVIRLSYMIGKAGELA